VKLPLWLLNPWLKTVEKPHFSRARDPDKTRRRFRLQARLFFCDPPYACYLPAEAGKVPGLWANARPVAGVSERPGVILYFHGGAYVFGAPDTHRAMLARLSSLTGLATFLPDYRLAPEFPFPAAIEDALAAYKGLLNHGYAPERIFLGGDSAGGGLMLGLLHLIGQSDLPRPAGAFAFSPWCDLTLSGESLRTNARKDPVLPAGRLGELRDMYLAGSDPQDPRVSPLFGDFTGAPPVFFQVGDTEILLDDSQRLEARMCSQNVRMRLDIWPDAPHVWQLFQGRLTAADKALEEVAGFLNGLRS
jgi:epsilon-lactone hydrolase